MAAAVAVLVATSAIYMARSATSIVQDYPLPPVPQGPWRTVSLDNVSIDVPPDCDLAHVRPGACYGLTTVNVGEVGPLDDLASPGIHRVDGGWHGHVVFEGRASVYVRVDGGELATVRRVLGSVRRPGEVLPDLTLHWRTITQGRYRFAIPRGLVEPFGLTSDTFSAPGFPDVPIIDRQGKSWLVGNLPGVAVRLPTEALAQLVVGELRRQVAHR